MKKCMSEELPVAPRPGAAYCPEHTLLARQCSQGPLLTLRMCVCLSYRDTQTHADMYKHTVVDNSGVYGYRSSTSYLLRTYLLRLSRSEFPVLLRVAAHERTQQACGYNSSNDECSLTHSTCNTHSLSVSHSLPVRHRVMGLSSQVYLTPGVHTRDFEDSRFAPRTATYGRRVV